MYRETKYSHILFEIIYGRREEATYTSQVIPMYQDNPFIEALPYILTADNFFKLASTFPDYDESHRQLPPEIRMHLILMPMKVFQVLSWHLRLEQRFSRLIRAGYMNRNPIDRGYWGDLDEKVEVVTAAAKNATPMKFNSMMLGFLLLGISGIGKSSTLEMILQLYPQIILHTEYKGKPFTWNQITWLKLDCPFDGSIKGLCINFFIALDNLLGTNYYHAYTRNGRATIDQIIPAIARLAFLHGIGVLVIDEIQHLSEAKSGGANKMLNFFTQLMNTVGMPVVIVGTPKARKFLSTEFRQVRRGAGQGDFIVNPMNQDDDWQLFLEAVWKYQYTHEVTPLTAELNQTIYQESSGITDIAVKLYVLAQSRAIVTGVEKITPEIIQSVAKDSFTMAHDMLKALRERDWSKLELYDDIKPLDIDSQIEASLEEIRRSELKQNHKRAQAREDDKDDHEGFDESLLSEKERKKRRKRKNFVPPVGSLMGIVEAGLKYDIAAYEALEKAGHIRSASEFII